MTATGFPKIEVRFQQCVTHIFKSLLFIINLGIVTHEWMEILFQRLMDDECRLQINTNAPSSSSRITTKVSRNTQWCPTITTTTSTMAVERHTASFNGRRCSNGIGKPLTINFVLELGLNCSSL
jgi:hypothetical protein